MENYNEENNIEMRRLQKVIKQLCGGAAAGWDDKKVRGCAKDLVEKAGAIYQTYRFPESFPVYRARLIENQKEAYEFKQQDLGPKLNELTKYGRCHQLGESMGYCSLYEDIALAELNACKDQHYVISTFKLSREICSLPVGGFDYFRRTGETSLGSENPASRDCYKNVIASGSYFISSLIDAYLADEFMKPVKINSDYKITSAFADVLFNELDNGTTTEKPDALVYPSVEFRAGVNFAIRSDLFFNKVKLVKSETRIVKVAESYGYGLFETKDIKKLKSTDGDALEWEDC